MNDVTTKKIKKKRRKKKSFESFSLVIEFYFTVIQLLVIVMYETKMIGCDEFDTLVRMNHRARRIRVYLKIN